MTRFLQHSYSSRQVELDRRIAPDEITARRSRDYGSLSTKLRFAVLSLLLLVLGISNVAADDYTIANGFYYLENKQDNNGYFLVPAAGTGSVKYFMDNEATPYLTTYKKSKETETAKIDNFIWYIEQVIDGSDTYYRFRHMLTGKYVVVNGVVDASNPARLRLHLETQQEPDDNTLFLVKRITGKDRIAIRHKRVYATHNDGKIYWWWDTANGNKENYSQSNTDGLLCFWNELTENPEKWNLPTAVDKDVCLPPVVSYDATTQKVSISSYEDYDDVTFYYTTDGNEPNTSSTVYSAPFSMPDGQTVVKAIAVRNTFQNPTATVYNTAQCAQPVVSQEGDGTVTLTCATGGVTYYYTIDGSVPTTASTSSTGTITLPLDLAGQFLRVIAAKESDGSDASPATLYYFFKCETPTITNSSGTITITTATDGAEIHYRKDGNNGVTLSNDEYLVPYTYTLQQGAHTIKARAFKQGYTMSDVASLEYKKLDLPKITGVQADGSVTLTPDNATFRYTTSTTLTVPSDPGWGQAELTPKSTILLPAGTDIQSVKIRAYRLGNGYSDVLTYYVPTCPTPIIEQTGTTVSITCPNSGTTIYYSTSFDGDFSVYETPFEKTTDVVRAYASGAGYLNSPVVSLQEAIEVSSTDDITQMGGSYRLKANFAVNNSIGSASNPFTGTIDGQLQRIISTKPLVAYANDATIKNVILDNVSISSGTAAGNVGAICCEATGATRIYNCGVLATNSTVTTDDDGYTHIATNSSTVSGSNYVGGLVGLLDGGSRVINCFSYANITGGSSVGGIVGYNNVATTSQNLKTMVMNCMFYGDITGGTNKAPIYNGKIITNRGDQNGVGNYNYFCADASYVKNRDIDTYHCALMAETRFLQRFEFFRHLLNSHRELAAWWATGSADNKDQMMKWVLEPSQIGSTTPFPILNTPGYYPSVVNIDAENATSQTERNKGGVLGTLTVYIEMGDGAVFSHPGTGESEAKITTSELSLKITDKDPEHFNFNYAKVQLPYYNQVGTKNYTGNRVVTGWKIVKINGSETGAGSFSKGEDVTFDDDSGNVTAMPYNFADRTSTKKDLYDVSGRVFNQGAYWDVPEGVNNITIQPYWAKAAYVADGYADVVYNDNMGTAYNVPGVGGGELYTNGSDHIINGENQKVYTSIANAIGSGTTQINPNTSHSVNDYAIVLVGNYHEYTTNNSAIHGSYPYTVTTIDLDSDNEPDYSFMYRNDGRNKLHPVKYDLLNFVGFGMAQKSTGGTGTYNFGIMRPIGWFESTNTSLFRVTQFEYDAGGRSAAPLILQGGVMEQWVNSQNSQSPSVKNNITYFHVGGNVWFKEFHRGTHIDDAYTSKHPPVSVTGGDYDEFYLTGLYKAVTKTNDDAECYINGGRFGILAGTGMEGIGDDKNDASTKGNIAWQIQNADIDKFYGGGINDASRIGGNITTVITGSHVRQFCGGPKFGDLYPGKTVITTASDCEFDTYFGAGYGGNSYSTYPPKNISGTNGDYGESSWNTFVNNNYKQEYQNKSNPTYKGVSTEFYYQYLPQSNNTQNVERILVNFVVFSLATTLNVTSTLTGCTINGNFYGGGSLGKVAGPVTSTLKNCTVKGNVFGAGYSASLPTVEVMNTGGFVKAPFYDANLGVYMEPTYPATVTYTWEQRTDGKTVNSTALAIDKTNHILYTNINLDKSNLGSVAGSVSLTIDGTSDKGSTIFGNVFGGGEQSYVTGTSNTVTVTLKGNTKVNGNVFGGGDHGVVEGSATVNIQE